LDFATDAKPRATFTIDVRMVGSEIRLKAVSRSTAPGEDSSDRNSASPACPSASPSRAAAEHSSLRAILTSIEAETRLVPRSYF
jgi:hypothetical protein